MLYYLIYILRNCINDPKGNLSEKIAFNKGPVVAHCMGNINKTLIKQAQATSVS